MGIIGVPDGSCGLGLDVAEGSNIPVRGGDRRSVGGEDRELRTVDMAVALG